MKKKEKKKRSYAPEAEEHTELQQETQKQNILSRLNKLDDISIAKSRITEGKIRKGLIKSQLTGKEEKVERIEIQISRVKREIEELRDIKQDYLDDGETKESIEVAKKIMNIAKINDLNLIADEEKRFIEQFQAKLGPSKPINEQIEELKKKRHTYYTQEKYDEAIQIAEIIIDLAKEAKLTQIVITEENFINFIQSKISEKSDTEISKSLNALKVIEEIENKSVKLKDDVETKERYNFKEEKRKFEDLKKKFKLEKQKFEEEKEAFKWEKQMLEELKKYERDKDIDSAKDDVNPEIVEIESENKRKFTDEKLKFEEEKEKLEKKMKKIKETEEKLRQEKLEFEVEKTKYEQEKIEFQEEKETFKWEKEMFEEAKKFDTDKDSS